MQFLAVPKTSQALRLDDNASSVDNVMIQTFSDYQRSKRRVALA